MRKRGLEEEMKREKVRERDRMGFLNHFKRKGRERARKKKRETN